jgi:hypothetical protein
VRIKEEARTDMHYITHARSGHALMHAVTCARARTGMPQDADFFQKFEPVAKQYSQDFDSFKTAVKSKRMEEAAEALMELR